LERAGAFGSMEETPECTFWVSREFGGFDRFLEIELTQCRSVLGREFGLQHQKNEQLLDGF
jgi:hypothetical protein